MLKDADKLWQRPPQSPTKMNSMSWGALERDSVLFVEELIDLFPQLQPKDFSVVLKEEKDHLRQVLSRRMESKMKTLRL
jgi:hypothetical protein